MTKGGVIDSLRITPTLGLPTLIRAHGCARLKPTPRHTPRHTHPHTPTYTPSHNTRARAAHLPNIPPPSYRVYDEGRYLAYFKRSFTNKNYSEPAGIDRIS